MNLCSPAPTPAFRGAFSPRPLLFLATLALTPCGRSGTVALWLFDEQKELYPSCLLTDAGPHSYLLALGRGAAIVDGRFGHALEPVDPAPLAITGSDASSGSDGAIRFGLSPLPIPAGRTVPPMTWMNATFAALATTGEKHLRTPGFANATDTKLNLGAFDWTVEFWYSPRRVAATDGTVFELGRGPRGENEAVTRLTLNAQGDGFVLRNEPARVTLAIASDPAALRSGGGWHHLAFVYAAATHQLSHYVDGHLQSRPSPAALQALAHGDEAYLSVGRDGTWGRPLPGAIDELRFSDTCVYPAEFTPPGSFSQAYGAPHAPVALRAGPPLLFGAGAAAGPIELGSRKFLFLDDALLASSDHVTFVPNIPARAELVIPNLPGHMSVVEDETGLLRLYYQGPDDALAVMVSKDGISWRAPDLGHGEFQGQRNIVLRTSVGLGNVFLDPNAPADSRYRYMSGIKRGPMYVFSSADGFDFHRNETAALPFAAGSQSVTYYDDQRQLYVTHHRSDYGETPGGKTRRRYVRSETTDLLAPWPFLHVTEARTREIGRTERLQSDKLDPWFLDNGPLTPPGLGIDLPTVFATDEAIDPPGTDVYVTKVVKYPWAPDAYLAFPSIYFHYDGDGPDARQELGEENRGRGSGVVEVQLAVSRDGLTWTRYPRPAYAGIGDGGNNTHHEMFMVQGLIHRGNEIWQYVTGHPGNGMNYHSAWKKRRYSPVYRLVQRVDGFVAAEAAYGGGTMVTKPLRFTGSRLRLNLDTGATGYAQVGLRDAAGKPIPGFGLDDCVYVNGDFLDTPVEWLKRGADLSALAGKTVQLAIRMRGARLYALQFTNR